MIDTFEINLARRLVAVNKLSPPIDVLSLLKKYADVEITDIPLDVDAVCLDLKKVGSRPKVIINRNRHQKRRRFTIAHELGHVLIPWHRGSIIDDTSINNSFSAEYNNIEYEANRFASELLMPKDWIISQTDSMTDPSATVLDISSIADVSLPASVFRSYLFMPKGFVFAEVGEDNLVRATGRSPRTIANAFEIGGKVEPEKEFPSAEGRWSLESSNGSYWWWKLPLEIKPSTVVTVEWKVVLTEILKDICANDADFKSAYSSVSATTANANSISKISYEEVYSAIIQRFTSKARHDVLYRNLINHPKIDQYFVSRAYSFKKSFV